jgi:cobalt-zinc-cadmium efflux system protein
MGTWSLLKDSFKMAVDAVPTGVDMEEVKKTMQKVQNVARVHHVHVWPLSTTENALTAHVVVTEELSAEERVQVVSEIRHQLLHQNIQHSTIELEYQQLSPENHYCITHK